MDDEQLNSCLSAIVDNADHIKAAFYDMKVKEETFTEGIYIQRKYGHFAVLLYGKKDGKGESNIQRDQERSCHFRNEGVVALLTGAREGREARVTSNIEVLTKVIFFQ